MQDIDAAMAANRAAVDDLMVAAERCQATWTTPWAPGKWSPSQIVEHVAMALEEGGNVVAERPAKLPSLPFFVRPLAGMFFRRVIRKGGFPKSRAAKAMTPINGPATLVEARRRLSEGMAMFEKDCRARAQAGGRFKSTAFGAVTVQEYARFQEIHTRHHTKQMPVS
jgi:hypothetical protein